MREQLLRVAGWALAGSGWAYILLPRVTLYAFFGESGERHFSSYTPLRTVLLKTIHTSRVGCTTFRKDDGNTIDYSRLAWRCWVWTQQATQMACLCLRVASLVRARRRAELKLGLCPSLGGSRLRMPGSCPATRKQHAISSTPLGAMLTEEVAVWCCGAGDQADVLLWRLTGGCHLLLANITQNLQARFSYICLHSQ